MSDTTICANCGHAKSHHWDRYGCEIEGPDVWVEGINCGGLVASGPCGCMDFEPEEPELTGHISTAEIYAGAGVPFGQSLRRCADALKQIEASLEPHLLPDTEREDYKAYERWREDRAVRG